MLTREDREGVVVLAAAAPTDLTAANAEAFDASTRGVPEGASAVLDLSRVDFLDSAGIGCLVRLHRRLDGHGGELRLAGAGGSVRTVLELVRLHRMLEVHPTVDAAVASFREDGSA